MFSLPVYWKQSSLSPTHLFGGGGERRTSFLTPFTGSNVPSSLPYSFIEWEKHLSFSVYWKQRSISTLLIYWGGGGDLFSPSLLGTAFHLHITNIDHITRQALVGLSQIGALTPICPTPQLSERLLVSTTLLLVVNNEQKRCPLMLLLV